MHTYDRMVVVLVRHKVYDTGSVDCTVFVDSDIQNRNEVIGTLWRAMHLVDDGKGCTDREPGEIAITVPGGYQELDEGDDDREGE
jgi:hypothetical protein